MEHDLEFYVREFARTGFGGGLNWYRNLDRVWELTAFLNNAKLSQPTLFIAGEADPMITMYRKSYESMEASVPNLKRKVLLLGAGHWIQQERPAEVNRLLLDFLAGL